MYGKDSYLMRFLVQQMLTGAILYPRLAACGTQKYYPMYPRR